MAALGRRHFWAAKSQAATETAGRNRSTVIISILPAAAETIAEHYIYYNTYTQYSQCIVDNVVRMNHLTRKRNGR